MLTLLGSLLGFGTSFLPEVLSFFREKRDQAHELALMDKQREHAVLLHGQRMEAVETEADVRESEALYAQATAPSGVRWVDGLRGSVRPVVTYLFMATFIAVEVCLVIGVMRQGCRSSTPFRWSGTSRPRRCSPPSCPSGSAGASSARSWVGGDPAPGAG